MGWRTGRTGWTPSIEPTLRSRPGPTLYNLLFFFLDKKRICLHFPICVEGETLGPADHRGPGPPGVLELPGSILGRFRPPRRFLFRLFRFRPRECQAVAAGTCL